MFHSNAEETAVGDSGNYKIRHDTSMEKSSDETDNRISEQRAIGEASIHIIQRAILTSSVQQVNHEKPETNSSRIEEEVIVEVTHSKMGSSHNWPFIINLGNSIIGVALLAMPFCFQKCGILLSVLVLVFCTWLTLITCHMLMKAGIISRRRSYEFLAYYTHGATGKFVSEIGMIGFQLGTLIAQIVVIGDLGPAIVTKFFGIENSPGLRTSLMILLCMTIGLPMALIKDIRAVSRISTVCVAFYSCFVVYVLWLALPNLWTGDWYEKVHFWRPQGLFQCLPILSFSFGCQTQLFLLYDALPDPSLKAMSRVVNCAVNLCAVGYLMVGFCGYIAFYSHDIPGDVIGVFPNAFFTDLMKVCFVFSIVITFPVIVFPCRASIYTLLFSKKSKVRDDVIDLDTYIPAKQLKIITTSLVVGSTIIGILIPNVEFILGMNGAIMGSLICYIFPALFFLKVMGSKTEGKNLAHFVLFIGCTILLVSTYATLSSHENVDARIDKLSPDMQQPLLDSGFENELLSKPLHASEIRLPVEEPGPDAAKQSDEQNDEDGGQVLKDIRQEPPNPDPPDNRAKLAGDAKLEEKKDAKRDGVVDEATSSKDLSESDKMAAANKALELELVQKGKKQDELLAQLEKQRLEQKILIEEQKQLLKEIKDHHVKDKQQGSIQPNIDGQQNPPLQKPQPSGQPSQQQQVMPQDNAQDMAPSLGQKVNSSIYLDNANQQQAGNQKSSQTSQDNLGSVNQQGQQKQQDIPLLPDTPQKLPDTPQKLPDTPQKEQDIRQLPDTPQKLPDTPQNLPDTPQKLPDTPQKLPDTPQKEQDISQLPDTPQKQQDISQLPDTPQKQQDIPQLNIPNPTNHHEQDPNAQDQQAQDTDRKNNGDNENLQQKLQNVEDLSREKRNVNNQSIPIINATKVLQNEVNENGSFDNDKLAPLTNNEKPDVNIKENIQAAEQVKVAEKVDEKPAAEKPKANEEMRRKLKYDDSVVPEYIVESVDNNSVNLEAALTSRSLLDVEERKKTDE